MGKSIIPIGKALGWSFDEDGSLISFEWFRGDEVVELTPNESVALAQAFEEDQMHFDMKFDRTAYKSVLNRNSATLSQSEIDALVRSLFEKELLIEIDLDSDPIEPFFRKYRIVPTAHSFGNSKDNPRQFGIGHDQPFIHFSGWAQLIWAVSHTDGSIWRGCELLAEGDEATTPLEIAQDFKSVVPVIVATGCGFLEAV